MYFDGFLALKMDEIQFMLQLRENFAKSLHSICLPKWKLMRMTQQKICFDINGIVMITFFAKQQQ